MREHHSLGGVADPAPHGLSVQKVSVDVQIVWGVGSRLALPRVHAADGRSIEGRSDQPRQDLCTTTGPPKCARTIDVLGGSSDFILFNASQGHLIAVDATIVERNRRWADF